MLNHCITRPQPRFIPTFSLYLKHGEVMAGDMKRKGIEHVLTYGPTGFMRIVIDRPSHPKALW